MGLPVAANIVWLMCLFAPQTIEVKAQMQHSAPPAEYNFIPGDRRGTVILAIAVDLPEYLSVSHVKLTGDAVDAAARCK